MAGGIESRESLNLLTRKGMAGVVRNFGSFLYWRCTFAHNCSADPLFHGYFSSGTQKLVQGETACGGAHKISPIRPFMATVDQLINLFRTRGAVLPPALHVGGSLTYEPRSNSPNRRFMANFGST